MSKLASIVPHIERSLTLRSRLLDTHPWVTAPLIISAPMRYFTGPDLAVAVSSAGGLGFIGPPMKPTDLFTDLEKAETLVKALDSSSKSSAFYQKTSLLPIGVGFLVWSGDVKVAAECVKKHRPCAAWLFAPGGGQKEMDEWSRALREASPGTKIWHQVGTVTEAIETAKSADKPDVLVVQGAESGGHGRTKDGLGLTALFPEVAEAVADSDMPVVASGGIVDGRGVASALSLGAAGAAMGTRFLASEEIRLAKGYQNEVIRATDGATSTVRTQLYNHLKGLFGWPEHWSPRGVINKSWTEHQAGVDFDELRKRHDELSAQGDAAWGPDGRVATYAGAAVGLVRSVNKATDIVETTRNDATAIINLLAKGI